MKSRIVRNAVPDRVDLRDRVYAPPMSVVPAPVFLTAGDVPVLNQRSTNACTGFALAAVVGHLIRSATRPAAEARVSPFMLYAMARRYDEFPGNPGADSGSSARGAMKAWYKHGACAKALWPNLAEPKRGPAHAGAGDWSLDAIRRPVGAYYRIDTRSVTDMQVALNEVGILYVTAACHEGWDQGYDVRPKKDDHGSHWCIPSQKASAADGGHAFAIVGYNATGFVVHNSWGKSWGTGGRAILAYDDWLENAMDCWVAQIGVPTDVHLEIATTPSLRTGADDKVRFAGEDRLRSREIDPFIIDMGNNGRLSNTGEFRTDEAGVTALITEQLGAAIEKWKLRPSDPLNIAIYAHGGLVSESGAARTAATWIKALYDRRIFPIFLMWETDIWSTLKNQCSDLIHGEPRPAGGFWDSTRRWYNERVEKLLSVPGTAVWGEMKENAECVSSQKDGGARLLYEASKASSILARRKNVRLHLIGHSAGSILHTHLIDRLGDRLGKHGWTFQSVNFMAPAVRADTFVDKVVPRIVNGTVRGYNQFHLTDAMEAKDPTCKPLLLYGRSLLYLVSQSFEGKLPTPVPGRTPILGMAKYWKSEIAGLKLPNARVHAAPGQGTGATTHGSFDDDERTVKSVIAGI